MARAFRKSDLDTTTDLVRNAVPQAGNHQVAEQPGGADYILRSRLLRLGGSLVLIMEKIKDGRAYYNSQMKAANIEELDQVANRLTRAVILGTAPGSDVRVGEVTHQEAKEGMERRPARKGGFLSFGPAMFSSLNTSSNVGAGLSFGRFWDVNYFMVKLFIEGGTNTDAIFADAGLGGNYFLSNEDTAPYLGIDFGGGVAKATGGGIFTGESAAGFVLGGGPGIMFLRTSTVNLDLSLRASVLLRTLSTGTPVMYSLRLGLYY